MLHGSLEIEEDIRDLRLIKDIRDELSIMLSVFYQQQGILRTMERMLQEPKSTRDGGRNRSRRTYSDLSMASSLDGKWYHGGAEDNVDADGLKRAQSTMLTVVDQNIDEAVRLERFAERATRAVRGSHFEFDAIPTDNFVFLL